MPESRDSSRRRFDGPPSGERAPPSVAEGVDQWRSSRPSRLAAAPETEQPVARKKGSGFSTPEGQSGLADTEDKWTKGSKFTPSAGEESAGSRFGSGFKARSDMGPPKEVPVSSVVEDNDWRSSSRPRPVARGSTSRALTFHFDH